MGKNIMVVDDERDIRNTLCDILNDDDYIATGFENGLHAAEALQNGTYHPDLIILDMNMPKMNGVEFLKTSEKLGREIPVVLLTASKTVIEVLELEREVRIVKKPVDLDLFLHVVKVSAK